MSRMDLVRRLAEFATRPLSEHGNQAERPRTIGFGGTSPMHPPVDPADGHELLVPDFARGAPLARGATHAPQELFVWFEDTSARQNDGRRGVAGLPESLLPHARGTRVLERRYADGHLHLLSAVKLRCEEKFGERIAALYTAALSVGTIAWIGTGEQYARAWREMYPCSGTALDLPDFPSEI